MSVCVCVFHSLWTLMYLKLHSFGFANKKKWCWIVEFIWFFKFLSLYIYLNRFVVSIENHALKRKTDTNKLNYLIITRRRSWIHWNAILWRRLKSLWNAKQKPNCSQLATRVVPTTTKTTNYCLDVCACVCVCVCVERAISTFTSGKI